MDEKPDKTRPSVAYFCMEYGLYHFLKIYSGGLGILAGDYLKQASDSNVDILAAGSKGFTGGETGTAEEDPMEELMEMLFGEGSGYSSGDDSVGNTVSFETTDLDGNSVNSADLFRDKRIELFPLRRADHKRSCIRCNYKAFTLLHIKSSSFSRSYKVSTGLSQGPSPVC